MGLGSGFLAIRAFSYSLALHIEISFSTAFELGKSLRKYANTHVGDKNASL